MLVTLFLRVGLIYFSSAFSDSGDIYRSKNSDDYVPCASGWYYFRNNCYKVAPRIATIRYTWRKALSNCREYGGDLVSIHSQEEQEFVTAYLQLYTQYYMKLWIGLSNRNEEGEMKWSDGSALNYSNFDETAVSRGRGEKGCVKTFFEPWHDNPGEWSLGSCEFEFHAACKMNANPRRRSPNLKYCSSEEGGGWKYKESCFHIVTESMTWQNAERHCQSNFNGHLLTIRDNLEDLFLELALPDIKNDIWIGIKIEDKLHQKWTSGWYVSYNRFSKEEKYVAGTCVARKNRNEWTTIPCSSYLPFICAVSKETPPVLEQPPAGSYCPKEFDDWRDFGGEYCYYIALKKSVNYCEANLECQRRGGHLASLHSKEESDILHSFFKSEIFGLYIGLIRRNDETFGWIDGSKLDYQNWLHGEPNSEEDKCVEIKPTMGWNDVDCDVVLNGYICSVKKVVSRLVDEPNACESFCIAPATYLHALISQVPEAKRISCKDR